MAAERGNPSKPGAFYESQSIPRLFTESARLMIIRDDLQSTSQSLLGVVTMRDWWPLTETLDTLRCMEEAYKSRSGNRISGVREKELMRGRTRFWTIVFSNAHPRPVRVFKAFKNFSLTVFKIMLMYLLHGYQEATLPCVSGLARYVLCGRDIRARSEEGIYGARSPGQ